MEIKAWKFASCNDGMMTFWGCGIMEKRKFSSRNNFTKKIMPLLGVESSNNEAFREGILSGISVMNSPLFLFTPRTFTRYEFRQNFRMPIETQKAKSRKYYN